MARIIFVNEQHARFITQQGGGWSRTRLGALTSPSNTIRRTTGNEGVATDDGGCRTTVTEADAKAGVCGTC